jgi:hypothetical protein
VLRVRRWSSFLLALFVVACGGTGGPGSGLSDTSGTASSIQIRWSTAPGVAGYMIHWGRRSMDYTSTIDVGMPPADDVGVVSYVLDALESPGSYFFAMTSYDDAGQISIFSNEIAVDVP